MTKIFYDVDTQNDFIRADGALSVPGAEEIRENLLKLTTIAVMRDIPIVGSLDSHRGTEEYESREGELDKYGGPFPDHCMMGTEGAEKIPETPQEYITVPHMFNDDPELPDIDDGTPIYFEKQSYDVFTNPAFEVFLNAHEVDEAIVYGVATDYCVKAAVLGMQGMGIQCYVVEDAIRGVAPDTTEEAIEAMKGAGAEFVTTKEVLKGL